ncbi:MAG: hypothetical protein A2275_10115 [Bacteroidetes bacterium RIFOXYA12_FULL_35_11]|nr:MAG: hypothetical protein A2X01_07535 [Bacteroidetes bacterium GWF2_35_48]OFY73694.1 MAG: hypothetical protein A2275_10115 [Bacteroidetes bacterium RIFOXYA12_FULL_35_11]HBX52906.1 hypothetical protein [Bacteroidales bacterium]
MLKLSKKTVYGIEAKRVLPLILLLKHRTNGKTIWVASQKIKTGALKSCFITKKKIASMINFAKT